MKKANRPEELGRPRNSHITDGVPTKIARILAHLLTGTSINRFEAERIGDHCLPSTISDLVHDHGLSLNRVQERVLNRWGTHCTVTRYSLPADQYKPARVVLMYLHRKTSIAA